MDEAAGPSGSRSRRPLAAVRASLDSPAAAGPRRRAIPVFRTDSRTMPSGPPKGTMRTSVNGSGSPGAESDLAESCMEHTGVVAPKMSGKLIPGSEPLLPRRCRQHQPPTGSHACSPVGEHARVVRDVLDHLERADEIKRFVLVQHGYSPFLTAPLPPPVASASEPTGMKLRQIDAQIVVSTR